MNKIKLLPVNHIIKGLIDSYGEIWKIIGRDGDSYHIQDTKDGYESIWVESDHFVVIKED